MPKLKLPAPPLPPSLRPAPKRPGAPKQTPLDVAADAGAHVVDWVDERTSLSGAGRWLLFRKVPKGTNWFYTLGSATLFAFLSQAVTGVALLILTMAMAFTGYLLPFDQRSYWATVVGVNINGTGPLVGPYLSDFLRGGAEFGATTLSRFYAIHMLLVPGLIAAMIGAHLYLVAKLGTTAPPWLKAEPDDKLVEERV